MLEELKKFLQDAGPVKKRKDKKDIHFIEPEVIEKKFLFLMVLFNDYLTYLESLNEESERTFSETLTEKQQEYRRWLTSGEIGRPPIEDKFPYNDSIQIEIFKRLLSPDYTPLDKKGGAYLIADHIQSLALFYGDLIKNTPGIHISTILRLDTAMTHIALIAGYSISAIRHRGQRKDWVNKSKNKMKEGKELKEKRVIEAYIKFLNEHRNKQQYIALCAMDRDGFVEEFKKSCGKPPEQNKGKPRYALKKGTHTELSNDYLIACIVSYHEKKSTPCPWQEYRKR